MNIKIRRGTNLIFFLWVILNIVLTPVLADPPAQLPLNVGLFAAKPNIMLMLDNSGSMSTDVVSNSTNQLPSAMPSTFKYNCKSAVSGNPYMIVTTNTPRFCKANNKCSNTQQTAFSTSKCFDKTKTYTITYFGTTTTFGPYNGDQLNWYFTNSTFAPGSLNAVSTATSQSRLSIAKQAATDFVDSLTPDTGENPRVRMGLSHYNYDDGGLLMSEIKSLDATQSSVITNQISNLAATDWTPLAETLSDIGKYFTTGETGNLTLHPKSTSPTSASINTIFSKADGSTSHSIKNSTGNSSLAAPIQGYCQQSFVVLVSDGLPSKDRQVSPSLRDYTGDCATKNICDSTPNNLKLPGIPPISTPPVLPTLLKSTGSICDINSTSTSNWYNKACQNGTKAGRAYEAEEGSDYLDDVALALFEMDLRPSLDAALKAKTRAKNNLVTYAIGIADPNLQQQSVLKDAAEATGGKFYFAGDAKELAEALSDTISNIASKISSSASVVANSARFDSGSAIFQGKFNSADWTGSLTMFSLGDPEDVNGDGQINFTDSNNNGVWDTGEPTEDNNHNLKLDGGSVEAPIWNAADLIPAFDASSGRNILTYKVDLTTTPPTRTGTTFTCTNLSTAQKAELGITNCSSTTDQGVWRLNYIRGDWSHEQRNPRRADAEGLRPETATGLGIFRNRTHLSDDQFQEGDDPWLLGDIVNSNPAYVSDENYNYDKLPEGLDSATKPYKNFVTTNAGRRKMIYVGANDGMLHGFDASATGTDAGKEIFAYIPNDVYDQLNALSSPDYNHQYSVDGSPRIGDVYFNDDWHTLLVGSTGAGGKAVFALDITDPSNMTASKVLWEISDSQSPNSADLTTDTTALRGFANNLGYTLPQPSIVKMKEGSWSTTDGSWAAVVANGYDSVNNRAVLYIINAKTGNIIKAFDTNAGDATTPNGLSTPITVDLNGDKIVDTIYAGDLLGNMWKFDVTGNDPSLWSIANDGSPLFVACTSASSCNTTRQPITGKPQVGGAETTQSTGVMVYFGTGKYFEDVDNIVVNAQTQSFYGIWDNNATVAKTNLQVQTITNETTSGGFNLRATTNTAVNYPTQKGWYLNLLKPSTTASVGERVVSFPLLRNGRIIFNTLIPFPPENTAICDVVSEGTSWLMEMDALSGSRLPDTANGVPWDITGDGKIDANDLLAFTVGGNQISASGKQSNVGVAGTPAVISAGKLEYKYTSGSRKAEIEVTTESAPPSTTQGSRQSWRQLE